VSAAGRLAIPFAKGQVESINPVSDDEELKDELDEAEPELAEDWAKA